MQKSITTLFLLESVDGKISTWMWENRDIDKDLSKILDGIEQYYALEQETDLVSLNTGFVMKKIWINEKKIFDLDFMTFVIVDNNHLEKKWVENLCVWLKKLFIITKNKNHPAFESKNKNLEIIYYENEVDFVDLFKKLKEKYKIEKLTIQSWWTLNSVLLRKNLIDKISIVIAPILVWWKNTPSFISGKDILEEKDLQNIKKLELLKVEKLKKSFLHLEYKVLWKFN